VQSPFEQTVRAWDGSYYVPRFTGEQAGRAGRVVAGCVLALGLFYCGSVAYEVIQDLRAVKLIELREEGLVATRKEAQTVFYRVCDPKAEQLLALLHDLFCPDLGRESATGAKGN